MEIENLKEICDTQEKSDNEKLNLEENVIPEVKNADKGDSITDSKISEDESSKNENSPDTVFESSYSMKVAESLSIEANSVKAGALSAIAMEYNSSDSEIEEITEPIKNSYPEIVNQGKPISSDSEIKEISVPTQMDEEKVNQEKTISSDSDIMEIIEPTQNDDVEIINQEKPILREYRTNIEITCSSDEVDSDDDSSSSEDDSEDSKSDASSDSSEEETNNKAEEEKIRKAKNTNQRFKRENKGEFDDLPPIEELHINVPEVLCDPLGEVAWIVDQMVVVRPKPGKPTLNFDSVLFVERGRRVLGRVFDVFGQVTDPHYCVRFNNSKHIEDSNIQVGMNVYFCPNTEYTSLVFLHELTKMKAFDPTGDDEAPEFSDDEEEQAYYQNLRKQQKNNKVDSGSEVLHKKKRTAGPKTANGKKSATPRSGWKSHHPWNTKRNIQMQHQGNGYSQQNSTDSQRAPCNSQGWYGPATFQQNPWPQYPPFQNPAWPMFYPPQAYGNANNFRPQIGFRPPFQLQRLPHTMHWDGRNQNHSSQNLQTENSPEENSIPLRPPPPPPPGV